MENGSAFYHALQVDEEICIGCSHCMKTCPTGAIRIRNGKSHILENRCIDCGECFKACPVKAIYIKQDDFEEIFNFKCRVALIPSVFLGQFPDDISVSKIYNILIDIGFTHVWETESAVPIYTKAKNRYAEEHPEIKPLISTFCPAVLRLIQVKYPGLVENLIPLKAPLDITAMFLRRKLVSEEHYDPKEIGLFYITPCASKIAAVKSPVGEEKSNVDGVINMDALYNRVFKIIKKEGKNYQERKLPIAQISSDSLLTSLTNGERRLAQGKHSLAIDGIDNVMEFLEKLEKGEDKDIENVDFLELRACDQSCPGGILTCDNRFLMCERMFARARKIAQKERNGEITKEQEVTKDTDYLMQNIQVGEIKARSMLSLDEDIEKALEKMGKIQAIEQMLPQTDCGICGAPTCNALANDIVLSDAELTDCIFIQRKKEHKGELPIEDSIQIMEKIWGKRVKE